MVKRGGGPCKGRRGGAGGRRRGGVLKRRSASPRRRDAGIPWDGRGRPSVGCGHAVGWGQATTGGTRACGGMGAVNRRRDAGIPWDGCGRPPVRRGHPDGGTRATAGGTRSSGGMGAVDHRRDAGMRWDGRGRPPEGRRHPVGWGQATAGTAQTSGGMSAGDRLPGASLRHRQVRPSWSGARHRQWPASHRRRRASYRGEGPTLDVDFEISWREVVPVFPLPMVRAVDKPGAEPVRPRRSPVVREGRTGKER
jgi:hypothetical protein